MQLSLTENGGCKSGSAAISGSSVCESIDALAPFLNEAVNTLSIDTRAHVECQAAAGGVMPNNPASADHPTRRTIFIADGDLKWESGIHRVQRVPTTESSGRVHTSAVSVVVLAEADQVGTW